MTAATLGQWPIRLFRTWLPVGAGLSASADVHPSVHKVVAGLRIFVFVVLTSLQPTAALAQPIEVLAGTYVKELMQSMAAGFQKAMPGAEVKITTGPRSDDDLLQEILRRSTVGGQLPDVVITGSGLRLLSERGIAVGLDALIAARSQSNLTTASKIVLEKGRVGNESYGVAFGLSMPVVLFNASLVEKAGGDAAHLPADWPGILALARQVNALGAPIVGGFIEADNTGSLSLLYLLQSQGGRFMDPGERRLMIATPQGIAALDILRGFGEVGQAKASMTRDQARQAFGAGTIGVFVTMSSTIAKLEHAATGHFSIASVPLPIAEGGTIPTAGPIAVLLSKDEERRNTALRFLEYLVSSEGQTIVVTKSGYLPTNEQAIQSSPQLQELLAAQPNSRSMVSRLPVAVGWFEPPGDNPAKIATLVSERLFDVVTLREDPKSAARSLSEAISPLLPSP
jgi:multiple sugar transport system substrate-binding protein